MKELINYVDTTLLPWLSLSTLDRFWTETLHHSLLFKVWNALKTGISKVAAPISKIGSWFHWLGYAVVALLFFIVPAPQFANDKEGLALIVVAALGLRVLGAVLGGKEKFRPCGLDMLVLAFFGMNVIATFGSHYLAASIKGLAKMSVYIASYFLFVSVLQTDNKKRSLVIVASMLLAGALISVYGIYQYKIGVAPLATWEDPTVEEKTTRVYATLRNPNLLAGYLVPLIPMGLSMAIMLGSILKGWLRSAAIVPLGIAAMTILCCVFTGSRGGYIGIAAGLASLGMVCLSSLWVTYPKLRIWLVLILVATPVVLALGLHQFPAYEHRILSMFAGREHSSNSYRINVYSSSYQMFLDNWWLGIGPGNSAFRMAYGLYMKSGFDALGTYCVPLEVAVESGVVGLGLFCAMVGGFMARAHQVFWSNPGKSERWILAGSATAMQAMMLHGLVDTVYYRPQVQLIFWLLAALMVTVLRPNGAAGQSTTEAESSGSTGVSPASQSPGSAGVSPPSEA